MQSHVIRVLVRSLLTASLTAGLFLNCSPVGGQSWPEFRGGLSNGLAPAAQLPTRWSSDENVQWKTDIHGAAGLPRGGR